MKEIEFKLIAILRELVNNERYDNYQKGTSVYEARQLLKEYDKEKQ